MVKHGHLTQFGPITWRWKSLRKMLFPELKGKDLLGGRLHPSPSSFFLLGTWMKGFEGQQPLCNHRHTKTGEGGHTESDTMDRCKEAWVPGGFAEPLL